MAAGIAILLVLSMMFGVGIWVGQKPSVVLIQENLELAKTKVPVYWVSGTEYIPGEAGRAVIRVSDYKDMGIPANCSLDIFYPNLTGFALGMQMKTDPYITQGYYYHNFTIPGTYGVYEERANCLATLNGQQIPVLKSNTFHVSKIASEINTSLPGLVWSYQNRTANASNIPDNLARQENITTLYAVLPQFIWNFSNRSLTLQNWTTKEDLEPLLRQITNASIIWSYPNRTLTSFPQGFLNGNVTAVLILNTSA